jgi:hypothetical protein
MPTDEEIFDFLMALSGRKWCCWDARWFSTEDSLVWCPYLAFCWVWVRFSFRAFGNSCWKMFLQLHVSEPGCKPCQDPQPTRFPGRPEINQPDPSGGQRTGRFVKFRAAPQPAEEEQERQGKHSSISHPPISYCWVMRTEDSLPVFYFHNR